MFLFSFRAIVYFLLGSLHQEDRAPTIAGGAAAAPVPPAAAAPPAADGEQRMSVSREIPPTLSQLSNLTKLYLLELTGGRWRGRSE